MPYIEPELIKALRTPVAPPEVIKARKKAYKKAKKAAEKSAQADIIKSLTTPSITKSVHTVVDRAEITMLAMELAARRERMMSQQMHHTLRVSDDPHERATAWNELAKRGGL